MHGRWFDERQLVAHLADGSEKFNKSNEKKVDLGDENENDGAGDGEGERLDKFGKWLEEEKNENQTWPEQ
jgi:HIV Tat-specific factor 1